MADNKDYTEELQVIELNFDDGETVECEVVGVFDFEGKDYIALTPLNEEVDEDGNSTFYFYGYEEIDVENYTLLDIDDDAEFDRVVKAFETLLMEEDE